MFLVFLGFLGYGLSKVLRKEIVKAIQIDILDKLHTRVYSKIVRGQKLEETSAFLEIIMEIKDMEPK